MTETNEDPVTESKQFDRKVNDFTWGGHQNRVTVRWLLSIMVLVVILMGLVVYQSINAAHVASEAKGSELSTYQSCINRDVQDTDQIGLWRYVIELTGDKKLQTLQNYIDTIFAERTCVNGPPAATIVYDYHHISRSTITSGMTQIVTDRRCVPIDVHVFSSIVWTMEKPRHILLPEETQSEIWNSGCGVSRHVDAIPADVLALTKVEFASGETSTVWQISGTETPAPSNMNVITWKTPEFKIVP